MKKLSELANDTMLYIENALGDCVLVVNKEDFIQDETLSKYRIFTAKKEVLDFDLKSIIEDICEEGYEDMEEDILDSLDEDIVDEFLEHINRVLFAHPVYYKSEPVLIDVDYKGVKI